MPYKGYGYMDGDYYPTGSGVRIIGNSAMKCYKPAFDKDEEGNPTITFTQGGLIQKDDVVQVHMDGGAVFPVHESHVKALKKAGLVAAGRSQGFPRLITPTSDKLVKTINGRVAIIGFNSIVETS